MHNNKPHVVIIGAGFAGLQAARRFARAPVRVTLIDRNNYHLFQPLLYQVAAAYLDPEQIAKPVRGIFRKQDNLSFRMTSVIAVDFDGNKVETVHGPVPYDYLVIANGGTTNYFGMTGLEKYGFSLKTLDDAIAIRTHVLTCFEAAALKSNQAQKNALLSVVIGGGGPAGVEMAGAFAELIRQVIVKVCMRFC